MKVAFIGLGHMGAAVEQIYRQARARYGDAGVRCSRSSCSKT
jgi:3-hydroxyisobutyrate dehydrogenase-like beta-hydroxyacid dehydrogenase